MKIETAEALEWRIGAFGEVQIIPVFLSRRDGGGGEATVAVIAESMDDLVQGMVEVAHAIGAGEWDDEGGTIMHELAGMLKFEIKGRRRVAY